MRIFLFSHITTVIGLFLAFEWGGTPGLIIAALLMVMEVSLSFDNAVVNATVLRHMSPIWQKRFLTWGILIAVFGMRLLFPLLIVGLATGLSMLEVAQMAFNNQAEYSRHVLDAHVAIASFGAMFLLMVFLHFIMDETRDLFWLGIIERKLAHLGKLESFSIVVALGVLLGMQGFLHEGEKLTSLVSGTLGVVLYVLVGSLTALFSDDGESNGAAAKTMAYSGFMGFMYLQLLDSSFSLDGVVGAFAISNDVVLIMIGLGTGAMFVRSLTVYLVKKGTLEEYVYLEHGAHYGIAALSIIMLVSMVHPVPEIVTGLVGVTFIGLSLLSSIRYRKKDKGTDIG